MFPIHLHPGDQFLVLRFQKHKVPAFAPALIWDAVTRDKYCAEAHFPIQAPFHKRWIDVELSETLSIDDRRVKYDLLPLPQLDSHVYSVGIF